MIGEEGLTCRVSNASCPTILCFHADSYPVAARVAVSPSPIATALQNPIEDTAIRKWFRDAEDEAGVQHVNGRGAYGLRRIAVDAAKELGISREGLQAHGGWIDSQVPDSIYADQEMTYARAEAARIRAKIRGEVPPDTGRSAPEGVPQAYPKAKASRRQGYAASAQRTSSEGVATMGLGGVEPPTSRLSGVRSNHLSYRPPRAN